MTRAEALKVAVLFRSLYQTLKGCTEGRDKRRDGVRYIPLNTPFAPSVGQIEDLSNYIANNEDRGLYEKTFGLIDMELLGAIYWRLSEIRWSWDVDIRLNLAIGNKAEVKKLCGDKFLEIVEIFDLWDEVGVMGREYKLLQPIFKNLIPPQEASPTPQPDTSTVFPITDLVIDTSTEATPPEGWRLPMELDTDRARKYFKRCIDEGWLTITSTGGEWKLQAVRLGYVCNRIYEQPRPLTALIKFFNNPNLKAQITQADYEAKTVKVKKWRAEIDSKIFFD